MIPIAPNIFIDPTKVSAIEEIPTPDGNIVFVYVDGFRLEAKMDAVEILNQIKGSEDTKQFWAGR